MNADDVADIRRIIEPIIRESAARCADEAERGACTDPCDHSACRLRLEISARIRALTIEIVPCRP